MALTSWTNTTSEDLYTVKIGNITCPTKLTEIEAQKVMSLINGIINQRTATTQGIQWADEPKQAEKDEKTQKAKKSDFPALKLIDAIGFLSVYEDMYVRQWSETGFTPEKVKFGLKKAIQEAGGTWDPDKKAYKFATKKAYNDFIKAQKAREAANKKAV